MNRYKLIAGVLLIFFLGVMTGALGTGAFFKQRIKHFAKGGPPAAMILKRISGRLDLTEAQQVEIEKIATETGEKLRNLRQKHHPQFEKLMEEGIALMKEKLTDEQKEKLDEIYERIKKYRGGRGRHR